MKDRNGVEIKVGMSAAHLGKSENAGLVGVVADVRETTWRGCPMARLASPDFDADQGWSSWVQSHEIAVFPAKEKP